MLGANSDVGQGVGDVAVGSVGCCGAVPGCPVRVLGADRLSQGAVDLALLEAGGRLVHGRPDQRVPHRDGVTGHRQQVRPLSVHPRGLVGAESGGGLSDGGDPSGGVGGRDQQQRLHLLRQDAAPVQERAFDARGQGELSRQGRFAVQLGGAEPGGQFQQGEGVSAGIADQALRNLTRQ